MTRSEVRGRSGGAWGCRPGLLLVLVSALATSACTSFNPPNVRLEKIDLSKGYRPDDASQQRDAGRIWLVLAFSGGGTRAAAFSYGVLEALRDTEVMVDGKPTRLLDEVDMISGVSGGSFPAAYYGLYGDRIFEDFEERFLRKNVQGALVWSVFRPWNLIRLLTPWLTRSDLASSYYDKNVFSGATFADLAAVHGPRIHINATDLPSGNSVRYNQGAFDIICSDLDSFPISYAVASSSAVPVLLSPVTLQNYAGSCGYEPPAWFEQALASRSTNPRGYRAAAAAQSFMNAETKRYIHLVDGGISDNLGLRMPLDRIAAIGDIDTARKQQGLALPDHFVLVAVNAETEPDPGISLTSALPSVAASMNLISGSQIRRYNFETLLLARAAMRDYEAALTQPDHPVKTYFVEVGFDLLEDSDETRYLKRLPTSFTLKDDQVDRLRAAGRKLLTESPEFQDLVSRLR